MNQNTQSSDLRSLREQPFELLQALQQQVLGEEAQAAVAGSDSWPGVALKVAEHDLIVPQNEVQELIELPAYTRVPGAAPWLLGIANVRGELLPIIGLKALISDAAPSIDQNSRVVVLKDGEIPAGFVVDRVEGLRRFQTADQRHEMVADAAERLAPFLLGGFASGERSWLVLSLRRLVRDPSFQMAG